jgi:nucleotide-binding universal stress UspA family protein
MQGYPHVVACVDGSPSAQSALAEARRIRALSPGRLSIVHVAMWPVGTADAMAGAIMGEEEMLAPERRWLEELAAGVPGAEPVFLTALDPAGAACGWAQQAGVDLLVVAPHSNVLERLLLGSFAAHLVRHAPCPVLLARPSATAG